MSKYKKYPQYKDSGVEWLGELPIGWIVTKIKNMLSTPVTDGPHETPEFLDEGIPFVSAEAISKGYINFNKIRGHISPEDNKKYSKKYTPALNDVYMIKSGATTGITAIVENRVDFNIWSPLAVFRSNSNLQPHYLLNYLRSANFQKAVELYWTYGTQQNIGMNVLENLSVPIPPFKEQQTIANYLDRATAKIDTLIEKQTKLIELLKEKRQAVISTAVTRGPDSSVPMKDSGVEWLGEIPEHWEVWKMAHAFNTIGSGTTPSSTKESYYDGYIPWVTTGELRESIILKTKKLLTDEAIQDNSSLKLFPINSIIIAMYGATIGRLGVLGIKATTNQACCVMTNSSSIKNQYLYYWLMGYRDEIIKLGYGGGQPNISQDTISNLHVSAPSIGIQDKIINYLDDKTSKIDNLITKATKAIELLKERRTALISAVVTGKVDVRGMQ